ncbi:hypothetical protein RvY_17671 [Ramazzottius varieornatus]|uniref:Uncharacterized protein n=1 Tax=Ramazzottius varieornatus TaxID=947166 RepID=A0A1D1W373_RAMVA|nr:hypothetical protein RvY_17671 [Ramazzottius varieornatus]
MDKDEEGQAVKSKTIWKNSDAEETLRIMQGEEKLHKFMKVSQ